MDSTQIYDAVIVGGGWAGSTVALRLGKAGKKVLILEAGIPVSNVISEPEQRALATVGNRAAFMNDFFMAMFKTPESPYAQNYNAPRPSVLDINMINPDAPVDCSDPVKSIRDKGYFIQKGPLPFGSTYERRAGGTSWHWLGTSLRLVPNDFKMRSVYGVGVDWPISYDDLAPYYDQAEYEIGVCADVEEQKIHGITFSQDYVYPMQKIPPTLLDNYMAGKLKNETFDGCSLEVTGTPAGRNGVPNFMKDGSLYSNGRPRCQGNTNCTPICPIQAKYDATVTLQNALATGNVDIKYQAVACDVVIDAATDNVSHIMYQNYETLEGGAVGAPQAAYGKTYIIAAHAIEAAKLLLMSAGGKGVANSSGQVGKNLMDHPMYLGWGLTPDPVYPFRGPLATSGIEWTRDGNFRKDRAAFRIEIGNEGWNWPAGSPYTQLQGMVSPVNAAMPAPSEYEVVPGIFGKTLRRQIQQYFTRQFRIGFLIEQLPNENCYVVPSTCKDALNMPRPEIHYEFDEYTKKGFAAAAQATAQIFKTMNVDDATSVPAGSGGAFIYNGQIFYSQGAGHVMGTHRMGASAHDSVTDADMKCWDHKNLYLVGCGSFPTTATANPTLTMMALAFKAADAMLKEL